MSKDYYPVVKVSIEDVKEISGSVWVDETAFKASKSICLTNGTDYLWAMEYQREGVHFTRYGLNDPGKILRYLAKKLGVTIVSSDQSEVYKGGGES